MSNTKRLLHRSKIEFFKVISKDYPDVASLSSSDRFNQSLEPLVAKSQTSSFKSSFNLPSIQKAAQ